MKRFLKNLFFRPRWFAALAVLIAAFIFSYFFTVVEPLARVAFFALMLLAVFDVILLHSRQGLEADREAPARLSNGDDNHLRLRLDNRYAFPIRITVIDELPVQLQARDFALHDQLPPASSKTLAYTLRPVQRGDYVFGAINVFVRSPIGLIERRYQFSGEHHVPVYPSFIQMRKYELLAASSHQARAGIKRIRRIGHTMEFDHIRPYVAGDDYRTMNWKATARKAHHMVNQYQDEKSQPVYNLIDLGRTMKMPFAGMSLLDYAINASLAIANLALRRHDRAGLVTFSKNIHTFYAAEGRQTAISKIMELLYNQKTDFAESSFELLYGAIKRHVRQRSLLLLYTNFETLAGMLRQLPHLRQIARLHLLVTIFFQNTELDKLIRLSAHSVAEIYRQTIAERFAYEKLLIVKELNRHGIHTILTPPQSLSVNTINKYLEVKARALL